jgi:hypothetical protein
MTQDRTPEELAVDSLAAEPLDDTDASLLREVADLLATVDPVPRDLVQRIQFALALDEMFTEVAQITRMPLDALATRGETQAGTRTESLTFSAESLSAMITVTRATPDSLRIDGWIAPPGPMTVRLRMQGERAETTADDSGRFVFTDLPEGFAQLSFHPVEEAGSDDAEAAVVTPLFQL